MYNYTTIQCDTVPEPVRYIPGIYRYVDIPDIPIPAIILVYVSTIV